MTEEKKNGLTCKACGKPLAQDDVRHCRVCEEDFCPGCVIDVAGNTVCGECKSWALECITKGRPVKPYDKRKIDLPLESKRRQDDTATPDYSGRGFMSKVLLVLMIPGFFTLLIIFKRVIISVIATALLSYLIIHFTKKTAIKLEDFPDSVEFDESGATFKFGDNQEKVSWVDIEQVCFYMGAFGTHHLVTLKTPKRNIPIDDSYERFHDIAVLIWNISIEKEIPYTEK